MNIFNLLQNIFKLFLSLLIFLVTILQINTQNVNSLIMDTNQREFIIEELRLRVPADAK